MKFSHFALYAYSGAIIWVSLFLGLGYFIGIYCLGWYDKLEVIDLITIGIFVIAAIVLVYIIKKRIKQAK